MRKAASRIATVAIVTFVVGLTTIDLVEAARRGGGGGGRSMSRGGPAAGGSFQRSHTRPQRNSGMDRSRTGSRDMGSYGNRTQGDRAQGDLTRGDRAQSDRAQGDRYDQRQDNMQDRNDQRQDNLSDRQDVRSDRYDDRKEYYDDRKEWYEDRWRRGAYVSVGSWGRIGCRNTVIVNGMTYYDCGGVRYERVYRGSTVTYVIVN
jgi:hypothetical protein